nr:hypothetical protein [Tanacetum cinerariifolium]
MSADSAVTYSSVYSEARPWSIPSEDPYEEAAQQLFEQAPHSLEYVPRDHVPVFVPEFEHPKDLVPAEDEAPASLLPPGFLSPLHPSGTPPLLPIPLSTPSTSRRAGILEAHTPPQNRPLLATPRLGCEVGESSIAAASRPGPTMGHGKDCAAVRAEIEVLRSERFAYKQKVLKTHARRLEWQHQAADDLAVQHIMHKYCPLGEVKKLEIELWNLKVRDNDIPAYTNRFQELALICTKFVSNETEKDTMPAIAGALATPMLLIIEAAMGQTPGEMVVLSVEIWEQPFKRQNVMKVYNLGSAEKKTYEGNVPKCQRNHSGTCTLKCHKCGKIGHYARDCRSTGNANATNNRGGNGPNSRGNGCFKCGDLGHFKRDCPKLNNKNRGNGNAQGWVYVVGNVERNGNAAGNPNSNIVTGMYFKFLDHPFTIDLMPVELGSFDAIIGMDWLRRHHAMIVCDEKLVRVPFGNETLVFCGAESYIRRESWLTVISCSKVQEYRAKGCHVFLAQISTTKEDDKSEGKQVKDIPIVQDFPKVFPENLPGLPPARPVEFQIDLIPGAAPVARAPYRLASSEMKELSEQLQELFEKVRDNNIPACTNRFQKLALICTKFVSNETEKVDKYISGLLDNIYGNVKSSKPKTLDETIELANDLMDQKLCTYVERKSDSKRKADDISKNNQQPFKKQNVAKAYNLGSAEKKTYEGNAPKCTKCQRNHSGPCTLKCHKCGKIRHYTRDYRSTGNTNATNNRGGNGPNPRGNGMLKDGCMLWVMQRGMEMLRETRTQMSSRVRSS